MRYKLKFNFKLGILFLGISFFIISCQKDDDLDKNSTAHSNASKSNITFSKVNTLEIKENETLLKKIEGNNYTKQIASTNRIIYNETYNFSINTDNGIYIENGDYHSYTFQVLRETDNGFVENIILSLQEDGSYKTLLFKYVLNDQQMYELNNNLELSQDVVVNSIELLFGDFSDYTTSNKEIYNDGCNVLEQQEYHTWGGQTWEFNEGSTCYHIGECDITYTYTLTQCDNSGGGSPPSGTSPGGNSTGSGTGTSTTTNSDSNPVITNPVVPCFGEGCPQQLPCTSGLNALLARSVANQTTPKTIKDNLIHLKSNFNQNKEMMYFMTPTTTAETTFVENYVEGLPNTDEVVINLGTNAVSVIMHSHYSAVNHLSVFSLSDLYQIYTSINSGNIFSPSTFTSIVVTAHGTTYAIKISNTQNFLNWGNTFFNGWNLNLPTGNPFINARENEYETYVKVGETNAKNEYGIASFFTNKNLGLELYKSDNSFSNWSKITPSTNQTTTTTLCN